MSKIVRVRYSDDQSEITDVQLDDGRQLSIGEAINMAAQGNIEGVVVGKCRGGRPTLRTPKDNTSSNNLSNLPKF